MKNKEKETSKAIDHKNDEENAKDLLMKKIKKKYDELNDEIKLKEDAIQREIKIQNQQKKLTRILKNFTSDIIIRIAEGVFQSIISLAACICYVISTYYEGQRLVNKRNDFYKFFRLPVLTILEITCAVFFTIDYLWGFFNAKNKKNFVFNIFTFLDFLTILPVFTIFFEVIKNILFIIIILLFYLLRIKINDQICQNLSN